MIFMNRRTRKDRFQRNAIPVKTPPVKTVIVAQASTATCPPVAAIGTIITAELNTIDIVLFCLTAK